MALKVPRDHQARKALKDLRDHRDPKDPPVRKEETVQAAELDRLDPPAIQGPREQQEPREQQARLLKHSAVGRLPTQ